MTRVSSPSGMIITEFPAPRVGFTKSRFRQDEAFGNCRFRRCVLEQPTFLSAEAAISGNCRCGFHVGQLELLIDESGNPLWSIFILGSWIQTSPDYLVVGSRGYATTEI